MWHLPTNNFYYWVSADLKKKEKEKPFFTLYLCTYVVGQPFINSILNFNHVPIYYMIFCRPFLLLIDINQRFDLMVFYLYSFTIKTPLLTYNRFQIQAFDFRSQCDYCCYPDTSAYLGGLYLVEFSSWLLNHVIYQAEKTITVVTSWANSHNANIFHPGPFWVKKVVIIVNLHSL